MKPSTLLPVLLIVLCCPTLPVKCTGGCTGSTSERVRHLVVGEGVTDIRLEVSSRISHRIVSEIFRILVVEILGYPDVKITSKPGDINLPNKTLGRLSSCGEAAEECKNESLPESMINLEVWLSPTFDIERWTSTKKIEDCGPLGPVGRAGWYIPEWLVERDPHLTLDHWRSFRDLKVASLFNRSNDSKLTENTVRNVTKDDEKIHHCELQECVKGIYRPPQCKELRNGPRCATLLADYPSNNFEFLKKDILRYRLYVEVAWLGPKLEGYVFNLTSKKQPVLFFNWKPNTLTYRAKFVNVAFPHCEDLSTEYRGTSRFSESCEFEVSQMQKFVWHKIKTATPHIHHFTRNFNIEQEGYVTLLQEYQKKKAKDEPVMVNNDIYQVACDWVLNHEEHWQRWLPSDYTKKDQLVIGGIFPLSGTMWTHSGIAVAAMMAKDEIERNKTLLSNYTLELMVKDGKCQADVVMKAFIDYVTKQQKRLVGILGPACSDTVEPIAGVARHFNTIIVSYSAEGSRFIDREKYPYFYRTIPENNIFLKVYLELFEEFNWNRVAALTEDGQKYPEYVTGLENAMRQRGSEFFHRRIPRDKKHDMRRYLRELKNLNYKIIIGDFYDHSARSVMCAAYKENMTACNGYVWFLPLWFASDWYDTNHYNNHLGPDEKVPCNTSQMMEVIKGHISLAYKFYADKDAYMQTGQKVGDWMKQYRIGSRKYQNMQQIQENQTNTTFIQNFSEEDIAEDNSTCWVEDFDLKDNTTDLYTDCFDENKEFSKYGGYAYDAVWVYALALDKLLKDDYSNYENLHTEKVTRRYMELLNATDFNGVSGRVHFENFSRPSQIILWQRVGNKTNKIGTYKASLPEGKGLELNKRDMVWCTLNHLPPHDGTRKKEGKGCVFEGLSRALNVSCDIAITVVNLIGFSLLVILVIVLFIGFKKRYEAKFRRTEARFRELGLLAGSGMLALDEWEMPRDHIVINRKLGEGAFGTVYGGEAFIEDRGWQAVAVKTLKVGANLEEKLDFLSEAEMMKRFDHTNVVRLIGVCTKGEPVYTVMEFMLYGDLKTYLLARRQLVKEPNRHTSEEVSNWQLTKMALDIARGLSYLADQKYVHRDLACRNCLVNANRAVKIADFGMCRLMYDRDYYRFNKRGMLPVRWMSPESLRDGFFTPMSDVWSYGVLLYEMITFGSFPYQGLSNNQVIEYVKNFNTLTVPKGCKPELESLLLRCWSREPALRPPACEIVEILAHHPELISPCLDMPLASVEVEDTDSIELTIHERSRVQSVSSSQGHGTPSIAVVQQRRNWTPVDRNPSLNGFTDISNGGLVHSESSPMALHTRLLPNKGQYVTLHCRGGQDHPSLSSVKDNSIGIASL